MSSETADAAPSLDLAQVIAERKRVKEEAFRRRKMLRKLRKAGMELPKEVDPEEAAREKKKKEMRNTIKKWLAKSEIWLLMGDIYMYLNYINLAADVYRQGILRDNTGFKHSKLWFRWAKACFLCAREFDTKHALNQALHFEPDSKQIRKYRDHLDFKGKSVKGQNPEPRLNFERRIKLALHHSNDGRGESMEFDGAYVKACCKYVVILPPCPRSNITGTTQPCGCKHFLRR